MASVDVRDGIVIATTMAMASPVRVVLSTDAGVGEPACATALATFHEVEATCSRFDAASELSRANARPHRWHRVGPTCFAAVREAWWAYRRTSGRFDPRVLADLVALGYGSWPPAGQSVDGVAPQPARRRPPPEPSAARPPWRPYFDDTTGSVHLDGYPIDLGGIGKGLAVRWASRALRAPHHLVEAGGDCYCAGQAPDGGPWRIGIEDPCGGSTPLAVLALSDVACATSSVRLRRWTTGGREVHHLIDPATGQPGGDGLLAVTVVGPDPAAAETWSKTLFLAGVSHVAAEAERHSQAAAWVTDEGALHVNEALSPRVLWQR